MTPEQLLQPRYLVIADYPSSNNEVGDTIDYPTKEMCAFFDKYPHLFRRLKWWEFRDEKDMPEYVKLNPENCIIEEVEKGEVFKVWSIKIFDDGIGLKIYPPAEKDPANPMMEYMHLKYLLPATAEEYEQFTHPATGDPFRPLPESRG